MAGVSRDPFVLLPERMAVAFQRWAAAWGWLDLKWDPAENLLLVTKFSDKNDIRLPYTDLLDRGHYMRSHDTIGQSGIWYRVDPIVHDLHRHALMRGLPIALKYLQEAVSQGWRPPPADHPWFMLTFSASDEETRWSAWWVSRDGASPARFDLVREADPFLYLRDVWPVDELDDVTITIVGVGSIGGTAAETLASAGIGHLVLVDPDRLLQHNLPRHRLTERDLGRYKVNAVRDTLRHRHPALDVQACVADVADDADLMRPLFARTDVIVCATDGVQSRRVANHLARRAGTPIVLVAVLEDGAFGEVVRVRPRSGCLLCLRRTLIDSGTLDPEPGLDREYGTGTLHRPMTAAPPDLRLMGELGGKAAVATVLERKGRWNQRLPGDWAIVSLQPTPEMPAPFDLDEAGAIRWLDLPQRRSDCPSCAPP